MLCDKRVKYLLKMLFIKTESSFKRLKTHQQLSGFVQRCDGGGVHADLLYDDGAPRGHPVRLHPGQQVHHKHEGSFVFMCPILC